MMQLFSLLPATSGICMSPPMGTPYNSPDSSSTYRVDAAAFLPPEPLQFLQVAGNKHGEAGERTLDSPVRCLASDVKWTLVFPSSPCLSPGVDLLPRRGCEPGSSGISLVIYNRVSEAFSREGGTLISNSKCRTSCWCLEDESRIHDFPVYLSNSFQLGQVMAILHVLSLWLSYLVLNCRLLILILHYVFPK